MADAHANFASSLVATAPSPATSGTSLVVTTGEGSKFPAAPFNVTIWPAGANPTTANAEIARCTAKSTDTLTITRAQEGTSARTVVVGDQIVAGITAKTLTDTETVSMKYQGDWSSAASFALNDVVRYNNQLWVCTTPVTAGVSATYVAASTAGNNAATGGTIAVPTGSVAGDLVVIGLYGWPNGAVTLPTGFTAILTRNDTPNNRFSSTGYKTLTSGDISAGTITIPTQAGTTWSATMHAFHGASATNIDSTVASALSATTPVVTPSGAAFNLQFAGDVATGGGTVTCTGITGLVYKYGAASGNVSASGSGYDSIASGSTTARTFSISGNFTGPVSYSIPILVTPTAFPTTSFALLADPIVRTIGTTKGDQIGFTGSGVPVRHAIGADGTVQTADSAQTDGWKWAAPTLFTGFYGDGSDGNVTITTTVTLTRDMYYDTLTVNSPGILKPNGFRVHCKTALVVGASGVISYNGNDAAGATLGASIVNSSGTLTGSVSNAGATATTGAGTNGSGATASYGGASGAGGTGSGNSGGAARTPTAPTATQGSIRAMPAAALGVLIAATSVLIGPGPGGSAGGGDGTNTGGGGASGGGVLVLNARTVTNSGTISANGGNGGNTSAGNTGGGGGGGGGTVIVNTSQAITGSTPTASGGTGGTKTGTGTNGGNGSAGNVFVNVWS